MAVSATAGVGRGLLRRPGRPAELEEMSPLMARLADWPGVEPSFVRKGIVRKGIGRLDLG